MNLVAAYLRRSIAITSGENYRLCKKKTRVFFRPSEPLIIWYILHISDNISDGRARLSSCGFSFFSFEFLHRRGGAWTELSMREFSGKLDEGPWRHQWMIRNVEKTYVDC